MKSKIGKYFRIAPLLVLLGLLAAVLLPIGKAGADVAGVTVTPVPVTVSSAAQYTVTFIPRVDLGEDSGNISIEFTSGTGMPASIAPGSVIVNNVPTSSPGDNNTVPAPPSISGVTLTITTPVALDAGDRVKVFIAQGAGITNPSSGKGGKAKVSTSAEPAQASSDTYTIKPTVNVSPSSGSVGSIVTASGAGFAKNSSVDVTIGDSNLGNTSTDASGAFSAPFSVPSGITTPGSRTIAATDGTGQTSDVKAGGATATFSVKPSLSISPTSQKPGSKVTLSGSLWPASTLITVTIAGAEAIVSGNNAMTDENGRIPSIVGTGATADTQVTIPKTSTAGAKTMKVTVGAENTSTTVTVTITPTALSVTPTSGVVGTKLTLSGSGLTKGGTVAADSITFGGEPGTHALINIGTDGAWIATGVVVPNPSGSRTGSVTIKLTDSGGKTASSKFTIAGRDLTISPASGIAGSRTVISGTGFRRNGTVNIEEPAGTTRATARADGSGNFAVNVATAWLTAAAGDQTKTIKAVDDTYPGLLATAKFKVPGASISVSPASAAVGTTITISGSNFASFITATTLSLGATTLQASGIVTDANGTFSVSVIVPGTVSAAGVAIVTAVVGGVTESVAITIKSAPTSVSSQLAPLGTNLVRVWGFDRATQGFQLFDPASAALSDLSSLKKGQGYWIRVTTDQTLVSGANSYVLSAGWNLIGWLN